MKDIKYITLDGRNEQITFRDKLMAAVAELKPGEGLHVIKDFEPMPIYPVMEELGYGHDMEKVSPEEYHVYFYPSEDIPVTVEASVNENFFGITSETIIGDIINDYPYIKDFLLNLSPKYSNLKNPIMFKAMSSLANIKMISARGEIPVEELIEKIVAEINKNENTSDR